MCEWFDETCGQLLDHLEESGVTKNTLVVYVTDNGWIQRTPDVEVPKDWKPSFAPKSKQSPYDGGTRTPIMISWPGKVSPGERPEVVSSIDLVPTMLKAANATVPDNLPGIDLIPIINGHRKLERRQLFGESYAHDVADIDKPSASLLYRWVIEDRWKLLLTYDGKVNRYKAVHPRDIRTPQLFDLISDPLETNNLADSNADVVARLSLAIAEWTP